MYRCFRDASLIEAKLVSMTEMTSLHLLVDRSIKRTVFDISNAIIFFFLAIDTLKVFNVTQ